MNTIDISKVLSAQEVKHSVDNMYTVHFTTRNRVFVLDSIEAEGPWEILLENNRIDEVATRSELVAAISKINGAKKYA